MNILTDLLAKKEKYVLVISGGGVRGVYALGVFKALEELGFKNKIEAIYGVSIGAIIACYRASGKTADEIFAIGSNFKIFSWKTLGITGKKSLLAVDSIHELFKTTLPKTFEELDRKVYIGAVDTQEAKFHMFKEGSLYFPLLGSMAIPGVFPPVEYDGLSLIDGGVMNNFPVEIAKKKYPNHKIIGIFLNQITEKQKLNNVLDILSVTFGILMRGPSIEKLHLPDYLFNRKLSLKLLDTNIEEMKKAFDLGYKDGLKQLGK